MAEKIFYNSLAWPPSEWTAAAGHTGGRRVNGALLVIAHMKRDVPALLTDRKLPQGVADNLAVDLRQQRPPFGAQSTLGALGAGFLDFGTVGVYVWREAIKDRAIVRVEPDGSFTTIGHFRYDGHFGGRGLYAEPVSEDA